MRYHVSIGGQGLDVEVAPEGVLVDGRPVAVTLEHTDGTPVRGLHVDRETYRLVAERVGAGQWKLGLRAGSIMADVVDERTRVIREMAGAGAVAHGPRPIVAPMPGMVVKVEVSEGDRVATGQGVVIVEAMKMENELRAQGEGRVSRVHVREGEAVEKDQLLVEIAPLENASD
jgi:biotin carboxyl carrier protein